jgi:hypothetical protein
VFFMLVFGILQFGMGVTATTTPSNLSTLSAGDVDTVQTQKSFRPARPSSRARR